MAQTTYKSTFIRHPEVVKILSKAYKADKNTQNILRNKLQNILKNEYAIAKQQGILQYQFLFPNNVSFLRMHNTSKFGDDLTNIRKDFVHVNKTHKSVRGFVQGKFVHGFRNTFPIFNEQNKYIGAMEASFASDSFQWYLNNISNIYTHFLVDKTRFNTETLGRNNQRLQYKISAENANYLLVTNSKSIQRNYVDKKIIQNEKYQYFINKQMKKGEKFNLYIEGNNTIYIVSFFSINDMDKNAVAWLVSYNKNDYIKLTLEAGIFIQLSFFLMSLVLIYFLYRQITNNNLMEQKKILLNDVLNSTDNVMIITDFKQAKFCNKEFLNLLNIESVEEFNSKSKDNILSIFEDVNGYLHAGLLEQNELPIDFITKVPEHKRIVIIYDKEYEPKAFNISVSCTSKKNDYLITLTDITRMRENQAQVEKKAYYDSLTRVYNRNMFDKSLKDELVRVKRYKMPLSIAIIDIDHFKKFNDNFGHLIGDEVLVLMAENISSMIRETDIFARWGGEEFVLLFKETAIDDAMIISEKLRASIEQLEHPTAGKITVSFGITQYIDGDTQRTLFSKCDRALYHAKENGRNMISVG